MPQTPGQQLAASTVQAAMAERGWNITDLAAVTGMDPGTIGDFLNGKRWPKIGNQGKFEKALGWNPGTLGRLARQELTTADVDRLTRSTASTRPDLLFTGPAVDIEHMSQDEFDEFYAKIQNEARRRMRQSAGRLAQVDREQEEPS